MKMRLIVGVLCCLSTFLKAENFNDRYERLQKEVNERAGKYCNYIYDINWQADGKLYYKTKVKIDDEIKEKIFQVDVTKKTQQIVAEIPQIKKNAENQYHHAEKANLFIEDNNIFINQDGKREQISFNASDENPYILFFISPDGKKLVGIQEYKTKTRQIPLIASCPDRQFQPVTRYIYYNKPGDALPQYKVNLFDLEKKEQINIDMSPFMNQYDLQFGRWMNDSESFTFEYNQRGHQVYQLVSVDANTGKTRIVIDERSKTFIYYGKLFRYYTQDDKYVYWISDRDNWRHLYKYDYVTGRIEKQLTQGEWNLKRIIRIDEKNNYILLIANGINKNEDPYNEHLCKLDLVSGRLVNLSPEEGNHKIDFNKDYTYFVDRYSTPEKPEISKLRDMKGNMVMKLQKADCSQVFDEYKWTKPEVFRAKGRDGKTDIWGNIYRPSNFDKNKKYPVIEYIYAGPHDSFVSKNFSINDRFSVLCEMGFIVVCIDGMGTYNRSKSFHDVCWKNLKDSGFPDRILWIKAAAEKYPYMDIDKVGIYGYSAGGQSSLAALLFYGDFYKVAVALCGCHDNRMDKIWWNEQWMSYPIGKWYSENSNVDNAYRLQGDLLLINGELDDNVDPRSTLKVVDALVKADKDFDQLYLPGYGHGLGDHYVTKRVFKYFVEKIQKKE